MTSKRIYEIRYTADFELGSQNCYDSNAKISLPSILAINLTETSSSSPAVGNSRNGKADALLRFFFLLALVSSGVVAEELSNVKEPPPYSLLRASEDYSYLVTNPEQYESDVFDSIKYMQLDSESGTYLTVGGELRPRVEYFRNRNWAAGEDDNFYSQRVSTHANLKIGGRFRIFTELFHGYINQEREFAESDELDFHQGFVEILPFSSDTSQLSVSIGRQELAFGASRLVGLREGPNIRRSFDSVKSRYTHGSTTIDAFYGEEVKPEFYTFDNDFKLFDSDSDNPALWGLYSQFSIPGDVGPTEAYYFGFEADSARFNDASGKESRHTLGIRRFGTIGERWRYNTELIYQFGDIAGRDIRAYNIDTDWHYELLRMKFRPSIGLKMELTSGDRHIGDNEINSFNPMFVNPEYYSLAKTITPVNMISIHPSLTLHPNEFFTVYIEWARFWRASRNDGLYSVPRFFSRDGIDTSSREIGHQFGLKLEYEFNRHLSFDLDFSYFIVDDFLIGTGESENILHIAPTISFKF